MVVFIIKIISLSNPFFDSLQFVGEKIKEVYNMKRRTIQILSLMLCMLMMGTWINTRPIKAVQYSETRNTIFTKIGLFLILGGLIALYLIIMQLVNPGPWCPDGYH